MWNHAIAIALLIDGLPLHINVRTRAKYDANLQHGKATASDEWWKKHKYDLTYKLCAEMSIAAYCKVVFVIFLS